MLRSEALEAIYPHLKDQVVVTIAGASTVAPVPSRKPIPEN